MSYERVRRVVLVLGLGAAAWLARLTPTQPIIQILEPDFAEAQRNSRRPTPDGRTEEQLSPEEFIRLKTHGRIIAVSGPEWTAFFDKVQGALAKSVVPQGWEHRVMASELKSSRVEWGSHEKTWKDFRRLHFWVSEPPLASIATSFAQQLDYYLKLDASPPRYLETYCYPRLRSRGLGSGFYGIPSAFAYPYLRLCPWVILAAFLIYALLPWPKRSAGVAVVARWRVVLGDVSSSCLLFGMFFAMPLFIVGSSRQAATEYLFFSLFFWGMSCFGLLLLHWGAVWGAYSVTVLPDRLSIEDLKGTNDFAFKDLAAIQPATFCAPLWLIRTLAFFALMGGRRGLMAAGQAALTGASEGKGYLLRSNDGRQSYIWYTDPMGSIALDHFAEVEKALERSGVPKTRETLALRGVFPPFR